LSSHALASSLTDRAKFQSDKMSLHALSIVFQPAARAANYTRHLVRAAAITRLSRTSSAHLQRYLGTYDSRPPGREITDRDDVKDVSNTGLMSLKQEGGER